MQSPTPTKGSRVKLGSAKPHERKTTLLVLLAIAAATCPAGAGTAVAKKNTSPQSFYSGQGVDDAGLTEELTLVVNRKQNGRLNIKVLRFINACDLLGSEGAYAHLVDGHFDIHLGAVSNTVAQEGTLDGRFRNRRRAVVHAHTLYENTVFYPGEASPGTPRCEHSATIELHRAKAPQKFR